MTRFARAKGSKSSNEKVPEEATPWSELKKGISLENKQFSEETKRCINELKRMKSAEEQSEWATLDDDNDSSLSLLKKNLKRRKDVKVNPETETDGSAGKKKKRKQPESNTIVPKKKKKKLSESEGEKSTQSSDVKKNKKKMGKIQSVAQNEESSNLGKKKKKKKTGKAIVENDSLVEQFEKEENLKGSGEKGKVKKKKQKTMKNFAGGKPIKSKPTVNDSQDNNIVKTFKHHKFGKKSDKTFVSIVPNTEVKLGKFQGFTVKAEDAKRLKELKKKMISEGIPANEIESALKLERRRCEKALARTKKNVCFNCRKPGHILSQCPEIHENIDTGHGVCYKCGSTEHTAYTCKVSDNKSFPFAECFICKEKGHIARECPDNPKGLYPRGGCCNLCGAVTHLKKDCPKRLAELEEKTIKLAVRDNRNVEDLDEVPVNTDCNPKIPPKKKPIKF
ncbi:UNVERIFIED_CONTAM: hypothetical protein PYX00_002796 [Menopon gallinae]|uniref:CCHC-type domain-containing protein n=1 Tax=Menopon gallinae TaxID=328185 RepID=A0AAW2HY14_9NEOP